MGGLLLCDAGVSVSVAGSGQFLRFVLEGPVTVYLSVRISDVEEALQEGMPLQVSVEGGYCVFEVRDGRIHLEYAVGAKRHRCDISRSELSDAIQKVRAGSA
ncbi:hypothetical protein BH11ARM2_BH11ARM2_23300 [soil metagenome]